MMLVLKCLSDETGEEPDHIAAVGRLDVDDRDYAGIVNRLESFFDCTLDLRAEGNRRLVVEEICARIAAGRQGAVHG